MLAAAEINVTQSQGQADWASTTEIPVKAPRLRHEPLEPLSRATSRTVIDPRDGVAATIPISAPLERSYGFKLLQQWEGSVSEVEGEEFRAVLRDLTNRDNPEEVASFTFDQIDPPDRQFITPGAVFYWWIGYQDSPTGTRWTVSTMRVRRLPAWTRSDIRHIERDVEAFRGLFASEE